MATTMPVPAPSSSHTSNNSPPGPPPATALAVPATSSIQRLKKTASHAHHKRARCPCQLPASSTGHHSQHGSVSHHSRHRPPPSPQHLPPTTITTTKHHNQHPFRPPQSLGGTAPVPTTPNAIRSGQCKAKAKPSPKTPVPTPTHPTQPNPPHSRTDGKPETNLRSELRLGLMYTHTAAAVPDTQPKKSYLFAEGWRRARQAGQAGQGRATKGRGKMEGMAGQGMARQDRGGAHPPRFPPGGTPCLSWGGYGGQQQAG